MPRKTVTKAGTMKDHEGESKRNKNEGNANANPVQVSRMDEDLFQNEMNTFFKKIITKLITFATMFCLRSYFLILKKSNVLLKLIS